MQRKCHDCGAISDVENKLFAACPACGLPYGTKPPTSSNRPTSSPTNAEPTTRLDPAPTAVAQRQPTSSTGITFGILIERIVWGAALLSAAYGLIEFMYTQKVAESAPQQAAGAAMAVCWAVIPYCIARATQAIMRS